jgi:hypothetical protein
VNDMSVTCVDRERIFMGGGAEEWAALEVHAAVCAECGEQVRIWKGLSEAAGELRQEWETPYLWTKIERSLAGQSAERPSLVRKWLNWLGKAGFEWQTVAALILLILVSGTTIWFVFLGRGGSNSPTLLGNGAVSEVERAEAAYQKAIDKLDEKARPRLDMPSSPLMASYREKLLVLNNAIAELREQAGQNPANAHLRRQLLAMYREKQDTLQEILEVKR